MKIFTEETNRGVGQSVIILDPKDSKVLIEMCEAACEANKRKTTWRNLLEALHAKLCCY